MGTSAVARLSAWERAMVIKTQMASDLTGDVSVDGTCCGTRDVISGTSLCGYVDVIAELRKF